MMNYELWFDEGVEGRILLPVREDEIRLNTFVVGRGKTLAALDRAVAF